MDHISNNNKKKTYHHFNIFFLLLNLEYKVQNTGQKQLRVNFQNTQGLVRKDILVVVDLRPSTYICIGFDLCCLHLKHKNIVKFEGWK